MSDELRYQRWLTDRQDRDAPADLADRIMESVLRRAKAPATLDRNRSRSTWITAVAVPLAACAAALLIGIVPYVYLLFVSGGVAW